jgi:hypothetical protein
MSVGLILSTDKTTTTSLTSDYIAYNPGITTIYGNPVYTIDENNIITYIGNKTNVRGIIKYSIYYTTDQTNGTTAFSIIRNGTIIPASFSHATNHDTSIIHVSDISILLNITTGDTFQMVCTDESGLGTTLTSDSFKFSIIT